ncbi:5-formyltetrahydrofolate cyclo-ligase [Corynebacterium sp. UBA2622]|uniref:5-formyltetrahydrofolate cyclo-ligase n=1 Tax=Corynebacterium sp. UBA2622 TaxID=1946393 RepID=UPI0025B9D38D|nr:5-formyltetrahydrofolate cyclo-ligase [Corynebacterium sp. UBA2622]
MNAKQRVREQRIAYRRHLRTLPGAKADLDAALTRNVLSLLDELGRGRGCGAGAAGNVAAYSPLPSEPGGPGLLPALSGACRTVFLPISLPGGVLAWGAHSETGSVAGALGIAEPGGARFTSRVLRSCDVVLAPALAVDKRGMRLGKGAGYYDRALAVLEGVPVAALVYDDDVLDAVPHDDHDVPVDWVVTPGGVQRV